MLTPEGENAVLPAGPPITAMQSPFAPALSCLAGAVPEKLAFAVGEIADSTGRSQATDAGSGSYVTKGAGDMVQTALFKAGLTVVNRRDPNIPLAENNWGIRRSADLTPSDFYVSGSINSLDFIPGGGARIEIAGVGPRYRQNRILVGLDLALTEASTGRVVANVSLQKQVFAEELGFAAGRFVDNTLIAADVGGMEREALNYSLRQMVDYAVFDLLAQTLPHDRTATCAVSFSSIVEGASMSGSGDGRLYSAALAAQAVAAAEKTAAEAAPPGVGPQPQPSALAGAGLPAQPGVDAQQVSAAPDVPAEAKELSNRATAMAVRAVSAAAAAIDAEDGDEAKSRMAEAIQFFNAAIRALQDAMAAGLSGPEGDAAALVVEQAAAAVEKAVADVTGRFPPDAPEDPGEQDAGGATPASDEAAPTPEETATTAEEAREPQL